MADPRTATAQQRKANLSPLIQALQRKNAGDAEVANFCPFGCEDHELDENGWCGHLVGFYDKGNTYEPRVRRKSDRRVIVSGKARKPMEKGFKLVKITTCARVYSPTPDQNLCIKRSSEDAQMYDLIEEERKLLQMAENIRNPVLEGEWGVTAYDFVSRPAAAATE